MNGFDENRFSEALLETAARWIVLIEERPLTESEKLEFRRWLLAADSHRLAFRQTASTWGRMDILRGLAELFPADAAIETSAGSSQRIGARRRWRAGYIGAGIAAAALLAAVYVFQTTSSFQDAVPVANEVYLTRVGETATIDLDDGSTIVANTDSRLSVEFSDTERRITLDRGEAFFEVEHDPTRVFSVVVGTTTVRAVGTAFSVFRDGASIEVLVSEGVVEVVRAAGSPVADAVGQESGDSMLLEVGQIAEFSQSDATVESIETDEIARRLFWRQGMLAFEGEPLEQVIEEFSRYTNVEIRIASDDIRDVRVGGYFDSGDLAGMLTALQSNFGIEVTNLGPDQVLLTSSR